MKKCPYCTEEIQDEAIKCKHCMEFLDGSKRSAPPGLPINRRAEHGKADHFQAIAHRPGVSNSDRWRWWRGVFVDRINRNAGRLTNLRRWSNPKGGVTGVARI